MEVMYEMDQQPVTDSDGGPSWIPTTFVVVLVSFAIAYYFWWSNHPKYGKNVGSKVYPMVGTYVTVLRNRHRLYDWSTSKLAASPTMTIRNVRPGSLEFWVTANPANVEHILKTKFENYEKGAAYKGIGKDLLGDGIFNADGVGWKSPGRFRTKNIIYRLIGSHTHFGMPRGAAMSLTSNEPVQRRVASHEFTTRSLRSFMLGCVRDELRDRLIPVLASLSSQIVGNNSNVATVDLQDILSRFTFDTICKLGFGVDPECLNPSSLFLPNANTNKFAAAFDTATSLTRFRFISYWFVWKTLRALNLGPEKRLREAVAHIDDFAMFIIQTRRKQLAAKAAVDDGHDQKPGNKLDAGGASGEHLDLLSRFMGLATPDSDQINRSAADSEYLDATAHYDDPTPPTELDLHSDVFLRDIIISFILAGRDTSSSGLSWFFWLLTTHRHVEHAICTEIEDIVRTRDQEESDEDADPTTAASSAVDFTFEELKRMHYLHAAVTESLRLYPPVPVDIKFALHADVLPDGTRVAANSGIAYHPFAMGRMERIWGADCCEFKPERWLLDGIFVQESPYKFAVFQAGPRMCLGKELAMIQMKMIAASVLQRFTFSMPDGFSPKYGLNLTMPIKNGLPVWVHPRYKN